MFVANTEPAPIQIATAVGFARDGQAALQAPYIDEYLANVTEFFSRSDRIGRSLVLELFPYEEISAETVARVDAFLERTDIVPSLRRLLTEGRERVTRSLRARAKDGAGVRCISRRQDHAG
jgi:aminopeptidase N